MLDLRFLFANEIRRVVLGRRQGFLSTIAPPAIGEGVTMKVLRVDGTPKDSPGSSATGDLGWRHSSAEEGQESHDMD